MLTARDAPRRCLLDEPLLQNLPKHRKDKCMTLAILHFFFEGKQMLEIVRNKQATWISKTKEARATHTIAKHSATSHGFILALIQSIHWMSPYWYYLSLSLTSSCFVNAPLIIIIIMVTCIVCWLHTNVSSTKQFRTYQLMVGSIDQ